MTCRVNARPLRGPLLTKTRQHDTLRSVFAFRHCSAANSQSMCQAMRSPQPANMRTYGDYFTVAINTCSPKAQFKSLFAVFVNLVFTHPARINPHRNHYAFCETPTNNEATPPHQFIKVLGVLPQKQHNCGSVCKSERYASAGEPSRGRLTRRLSWLAREVWYCSASGSSRGGLAPQCFRQLTGRLGHASL